MLHRKVDDYKKVQNARENYDEAMAYRYTLTFARGVPSDLLRTKSRKDLSFTALYERPSDYRGDLVHMEGRLKKLEPFHTKRADDLLWNEGIKKTYEAWIFPEESTNPICVVFSELPAGIEPSPKNDFRVDYGIECDAYFFKIYRYPVEESGKKKYRDAPLFLGRSFTVTDRAVYFIPVAKPGKIVIKALDVATRKIRDVGPISNKPLEGMSVSPDGEFLLYTQQDSYGSDLIAVENLQ